MPAPDPFAIWQYSWSDPAPPKYTYSWHNARRYVAKHHTATDTYTAELDRRPHIEYESIPILACRYAGLKLERINHPDVGRMFTVRFLSVVSSNESFGRDASATCNKIFYHQAPDWDCTCGFYAVPADMLPRHNYSKGLTTLQVELSGLVVAHDEGYRAEHQRVLEVVVQRCHCGKPSDAIHFDKASHLYQGVYCATHSERTLGLLADWCQLVRAGRLKELIGIMDQVSSEDTKYFNGVDGIQISLEQASTITGIPFKSE